MKRFNLSEGIASHSQRNNEIDPMNTCVPTAILMMLKYSNVPFPEEKKYSQPEDFLTYFCRNDSRVLDYYKNNPQSYIRTFYTQKIPPNQVHDVMCYATNLWLGGNQKIEFTTQSSLSQLARKAMKGKASVLLGDFPYERKDKVKITLGHAVCFVGFETAQDDVTVENLDTKQITGIIIDDPFGDYRSMYSSIAGNDIIMPINDFNAIIRNSYSNAKWCYTIKE